MRVNRGQDQGQGRGRDNNKGDGWGGGGNTVTTREIIIKVMEVLMVAIRAARKRTLIEVGLDLPEKMKRSRLFMAMGASFVFWVIQIPLQ